MMIISEIDEFDEARYTDCIPSWFKELDFVSGFIEASYSGEVKVFGKDSKDNYYGLHYSYGSCSGCDDWENRDLSKNQIEEEISHLIIKYSKDEYEALMRRINNDY